MIEKTEDIEIISCEEMSDGNWKVNLKNPHQGQYFLIHKGKIEITGPATIITEKNRWEGWKNLSDDMKKAMKPWITKSTIISRKEKPNKLLIYRDVKIEVFTIDDVGEDHDDKYCAIVMGWTGNSWVNTGIVVREYLPVVAFSKAMDIAIKEGLWK